MGFDVNFSLVFCGFLSMVVVGVLLPWIYRGGFFFDIYIYCVVVVVVYLIFCVVAVVVVDYLIFCVFVGFLWVVMGFFSAGSGGFLVTEVVVMGG